MTKQPMTRIHSIVPIPNNGGFLNRTAQSTKQCHDRPIDDRADSSPLRGPFPVVGDGGHKEEDRAKSHGRHSHEDGKQRRRRHQCPIEGKEEEEGDQEVSQHQHALVRYFGYPEFYDIPCDIGAHDEDHSCQG